MSADGPGRSENEGSPDDLPRAMHNLTLQNETTEETVCEEPNSSSFNEYSSDKQNTHFVANVQAERIEEFNQAADSMIINEKYYKGQKVQDRRRSNEVPPCIPDEILNSNIQIDLDVILEIKNNLSEWKELGRRLPGGGLKESNLDSIKKDFLLRGTAEMVFQVLNTWCERDPDTATIGNLAKILRKMKKISLALQLQKFL